LLALAFAAHIAAAFVWRAWPGLSGSAPVCWLRGWVGIECPFCGLTRSFVAVAGGDLAGATSMHPGGPVLFAFMLVSLAWIVSAWIRRARPLWLRPGYLPGFGAVATACVTLGLARTLWS
jgi:hypothetical protein